MSFYIAGPVTTDPQALRQRAIDYLAAYLPAGWALADGEPLSLLIDWVCQLAAEQGDVANAMLANAFRYFGGLVNVPPIDATPATATATFTVSDTAGHTIPAGTVIGLTDASNTLQGFDLLADLVIASGATTGSGMVQAETPGTVANGLSGTAQVVQAPSFVTAATMTASSAGVDAEDDQTYLSRLAETLTLLSPRPVLPNDFAILARSVAGVYRAAAVDLLKPGPPYDVAAEATGQEKNVTVAVTDINGASVGSTIRGNVATYLQGFREQNFKVWVVDAQYNQIDVTATVYAWPGYGTSDVQTRVVAALTGFLSPAGFAPDLTGAAVRWQNDPYVRLSNVHQTIMQVPGVRYVEPLTFGLHGGALATTDVHLGASSAIPALPQVGTLTVTVNATV